MCDEVDIDVYGELWRLCPDHATCLTEHNPHVASSVAVETLAYFDAKTAIIEFNYFDIDFRSEFAVKHETTFAASDVDVWRYHFFDQTVADDDTPLYDFVKKARDTYLGYTTLRPTTPATVGRSVVPFVLSQVALTPPITKGGYVRTAVTEHLNLFGVPLTATGVPFMEQDGALLRCSHVASWMTHYNAVLKGWVGRKPSATFATDTYDLQSFGRNYPALGASTLVQTQLLRRAGLPPEFIEPAGYREPKPALQWYDRPDFANALTKVQGKGKRKKAATERLWLKESMASAMSHYLNSGIPCIFNTADHSLLVCGYYRERDLPVTEDAAEESTDTDQVEGPQPHNEPPTDGHTHEHQPNKVANDPEVSENDGTSIAGFVVHDDQEGPFQLKTLDELADLVQDPEEDCTLVIPLPAGIWLSSTDAQSLGAVILSGVIEQRLDALQAPTPEDPDEHDPTIGVPEEAINELKKLDDAIKAGTPSAYFLRTYAMHAVDFKRDFARRIDEPNAARVSGYTLMPKYVWIVELIERDLHTTGVHAVRATVVLDATVAAPEVEVSPAALMAHVPGQVAHVAPELHTPQSWVPSIAHAYESGRWIAAPDSIHGEQATVSQHFKTATM